MSIRVVLSSCSQTYTRHFLSTRRFASFLSRKGDSDTEEKPIYETVDETPVYEIVDVEKQNIIEAKRNKSRLTPAHRNVLFDQKPYDESYAWYHDTVRYKKRMLGRYGLEAVGIPAGFAWPTPEEVDEAKEYERVAYPRDIREEWQLIKEKHRKEAEYIRTREAEIHAKMAKMEKWTIELQNRLAKKEADMKAAKEKKDRLMEEVRRHFGYKISLHDERFKEMLAQKEKEEKKKLKEAKKKKRQEMIIARAMGLTVESTNATKETNENQVTASEMKDQQQT